MTPEPFDLTRIGAGLPVAAVVGDLAEALEQGAAVLQAPPGTGKTTLIPPFVANLLAARGGAARNPDDAPTASSPAPSTTQGEQKPSAPTAPCKDPSAKTSKNHPIQDLPNQGRVIVTQPRRVAARAAASRLSHLTGTDVGNLAGFTVRGQSSVTEATHVEFVTPGILLNRVLQDPELPGVAAVLLDEVHERNLDTDLLLGMLAEVRELRRGTGDPLNLVAMSATLDTERFAHLLPVDGGGPSVVVSCPSVLHPLDVTWRPPPGQRLDDRGLTRDFLRHVADVSVQAHRDALDTDPDVDALVFLPGAWEVARVAERIRASGSGVEVLELHGRVSPRDQDRAVSGRGPGDPPRVVVTTNLAESSLTVPGVRLVIDSGLSREPRRDTVRAMSGLVTVSASRASAEQRAGRAARLGRGHVVRCYDDRTWAAMPAHPTPEIAAADLTDAALTLAVWGTPRGEGLSLPDPPPTRALAEAESVLRHLGAIDDEGRATDLGRRLATVPVDPRLARGLLDGAALVGARAAAEVIALLSGDQRPSGGDLLATLRALRRGRGAGRTGAGADLSEAVRQTWRREARRLERIVASSAPVPASDSVSVSTARHTGGTDRIDRLGGTDRTDRPGRAGQTELGESTVGAVVALARPEWIARGDGATYLLAGGTRAGLPSGSSGGSGLGAHEWLAVADVSRVTGKAAGGTGAVIRAAAPLEQAVAESVGGGLLRDETDVDFLEGRLTARRVRALGAIILTSTPTKPTPEQAEPAIHTAFTRDGVQILPWSESARDLRARMAALHLHLGQPWPAVDDAALLSRLDTWLAPEISMLARGGRLKDIDVESALSRLLPWPEAARLEELAPRRLAVPSGSRPRIHWDGEQPVVRVKLQECFGLADSPRVLGGRIPVLFHLLSPAGWELAITADLASFWSGPYTQVRAEMRGRYPKHPWPEDPWNAVATARTTARMRDPGRTRD